MTDLVFFDAPDLHGALCAQSDPETWFPDPGTNTDYARKICARCPVQRECRDWALRTNQRYGIWGGTSSRDRQTLRKAENNA